MKHVLKQMSASVRRQRLDESIHCWAKKIADPLPAVREKVQALVDAFRANARIHSRAINEEVIFSAAQVLFEDRAYDSDDVAVALATACMSIDIPVKIIAASYKGRPSFTHVYFAVRDEKGAWLKVDGTSRLPVGEVIAAEHEMEELCFLAVENNP